jgi:hypothetical protein
MAAALPPFLLLLVLHAGPLVGHGSPSIKALERPQTQALSRPCNLSLARSISAAGRPAALLPGGVFGACGWGRVGALPADDLVESGGRGLVTYFVHCGGLSCPPSVVRMSSATRSLKGWSRSNSSSGGTGVSASPTSQGAASIAVLQAAS